jgi:hypothetical protein
MPFVQIIEFRSPDLEAMLKVEHEWEEASRGKRTARRQIFCQDRDEPDRYFSLVFFDSYQSAMENSRLPETQAASEQFEALADGPATFYNCCIREDQLL